MSQYNLTINIFIIAIAIKNNFFYYFFIFIAQIFFFFQILRCLNTEHQVDNEKKEN